MTNLRQIADGKVIIAYGTSEGAAKGWDARGRGRKTQPTSRNKGRIAAPRVGDKKRYARLKHQYESIGKELERFNSKLSKAEDVKSTWGKFLHFLRSIGEWHDAWGNVKDLILEVAAGVFLLKGVANAQTVHNTLNWGYTHLAPVMQHLSTVVHQSKILGSEDTDFRAGAYSLRSAADGKVLARW